MICGFVLLVSCAANDWRQRSQDASQLALSAGWQSHSIPTPDFALQAWFSPRSEAQGVTVYIEGDGFAWVSSRRPSENPTPGEPMALKLALAQATGNVVYLARPCQYVDTGTQPQCRQNFWTEGRFSEPVIRSTSEALDAIKKHYDSEAISLVGYSGGGAVAVLVAARREDVRQIITVAGNLDHREWTKLHGLSPLDTSLNPADEWRRVQHIPQVHFVGSNDKVIPLRIAEAYKSRFGDSRLINIEVIAGFDHHCCWQLLDAVVQQQPDGLPVPSPGTTDRAGQ